MMAGPVMDGYPDTIGFSIVGDFLGRSLGGDWVHWHVALGRPQGAGLLDPWCWHWHGLDAANDQAAVSEADGPK